MTPRLPTSTFEAPPTPGLKPEDSPKDPAASSRNPQSTAAEKLTTFGLKPISWYGSCEANKVSTGSYDVPKDEGGMYALVFDNTFAKQLSKKAALVLLTYPTNAPPQSYHLQHPAQGPSNESTASLKEASRQRSKSIQQEVSESVKKLRSHASDDASRSDESQGRRRSESDLTSDPDFFNGYLQKRRRKKHQGWARRYFSLNYKTSTLSYYHDRNTHAIRGTVPLSLAAIGANSKTRQISIDSGAEIWHLKASNDKDYQAWKQALELARTSIIPSSPGAGFKPEFRKRQSTLRLNPQEEREWAGVEALIARVVNSKEAARALAKDTDPKYLSLSSLKPVSVERLDPQLLYGNSSSPESLFEPTVNGYFNSDDSRERRPFWKRKPSAERSMPGMFRRSASATPAMTPQRSAPPTPGTTTTSLNNTLNSSAEEALHDRCMALFKDLDSITRDFALLLNESKQRRDPIPSSAMSRMSMESQGSDEFFDAEGYNDPQLLAIHPESDDEANNAEKPPNEDDSGCDSDSDDQHSIRRTRSFSIRGGRDFPPKPSSLYPLPTQAVKRRTSVPQSITQPPSLIAFFRKNVGKDLSTISMPVSANEPTSLVQRISEALEYSKLLDSAAAADTSAERLLYVTAFAISMLSNSRSKERALRKPFNPMLGETFELVREDRGFRFIAEKISHRPVQLACQAEGNSWCFLQSPSPSQKFWGKSAEIITEGKFRILLHPTGERFSWCPATTFLRNIIAGEKYVEPVGTIKINNETTGEGAIVTFKTGGMFSGRSEDVVAQLYNSLGEESSLGLTGKWTTSLYTTESGFVRPDTPPIWTVGDLVPDASRRYGFTTFAASLNEITTLERGKLPPTDSRLRPDQRAAEDGDLEQAELLKTRLEEAQRARRKEMEDAGETWQPRWFKKLENVVDADGEVPWIGLSGSESYWEKRRLGDWKGVERVLEV